MGKGTTNDPVGPVVAKLGIPALHFALFRCEAEEREEGFPLALVLLPGHGLALSFKGRGVYEIPQFGKLLYGGLEGYRPALERVAQTHECVGRDWQAAFGRSGFTRTWAIPSAAISGRALG